MQSNKEKQERKLLVADAGSRHHYLLHLLAKTLTECRRKDPPVGRGRIYHRPRRSSILLSLPV